MTPNPAAGWYPDPLGGSGHRWWDGEQWTEATLAHEAVPGRSLDAAGPRLIGTAFDLASPGRRLLARVVDGALIGVVLLALFLVLMPVLAGPVGLDEDPWAIFLIVLVFLALVGLVVPVYEITLVALRGQTVGKLALRIRVVRADDGGVPGWGTSALRFLLLYGIVLVPAIGSILQFVVFLSLLWDPDRQGWQDKAAKTYVVTV